VPQQAPPHELARITPRAAIHAPRVSTPHGAQAESFSRQLAQQQQQFSQTIAKLRSENNPVAGAATPVDTSPTVKRYTNNFSGSIGSPDIG